jgi:hypothetical protein
MLYYPTLGNIYPQAELGKFLSHHTALMKYGPIATCHSSKDGCFITWIRSRRQPVDLSYDSGLGMFYIQRF